MRRRRAGAKAPGQCVREMNSLHCEARAALPGGLPHVRLQALSRRLSTRTQSVKCTCRSRSEDAPVVTNLKKL